MLPLHQQIRNDGRPPAAGPRARTRWRPPVVSSSVGQVRAFYLVVVLRSSMRACIGFPSGVMNVHSSE
jgi:hypothetical protein